MRRIIPLILALLLSACGFHLRGMIEIPKWLNNVAVNAQEGNPELVSILKAQLEGYKIAVNPSPALANYWLIINYQHIQQQIISIGSSTKPRQYQLILTIEFMLQTSKGIMISPPKQVLVTRQLTVNNDRILGSNEEQDLLIKEMQKEAVIQIINRLSRTHYAN